MASATFLFIWVDLAASSVQITGTRLWPAGSPATMSVTLAASISSSTSPAGSATLR